MYVSSALEVFLRVPVRTGLLTPAGVAWYTNMAAVSLFLVHQYGHRNVI